MLIEDIDHINDRELRFLNQLRHANMRRHGGNRCHLHSSAFEVLYPSGKIIGQPFDVAFANKSQNASQICMNDDHIRRGIGMVLGKNSIVKACRQRPKSANKSQTGRFG